MTSALFSFSALLSAARPAGPALIDRFVGRGAGVLSRRMATLTMDVVDWLLGIFGLEHNETLVTFLYAAVVLAISLAVGYAAKWIIFAMLRLVARRWSSGTYRSLSDVGFFSKLCRMIPALTFLVLIQFTLSSHNALSAVLTRLTLIYVVYVSALALSSLADAVWQRIDSRENKQRLPLKGLSQLAKGMVWIIALIVVVAILVNRSPASLIAGLGAFAAVLMLVFKDTILSLVAGVQLSEDQSLHVGDWIKVDGTDANGTVTEVNLISVKVLNWDKTTTTLPPYSLISGSFTNYRSMQQSNTRRISRCWMIDADSILPATPAMLENIRRLPLMEPFIAAKLRQRQEGHVADVDNPEGLVNGTIDTNLGLFRAYMKMWLDACPHVSHTSDCFVSCLEQTPSGVPFQIYCFTNTSAWFAYEAIQDMIFEHLASMLSAFQLYAFENPSSRDTVVAGYVSPGAKIDDVFGVPWPFFQEPDAPDSPASSRSARSQVFSPLYAVGQNPNPAPPAQPAASSPAAAEAPSALK